ncbi:hypothetical protein C5952_22950, partial [Cronobacter sakazakii]
AQARRGRGRGAARGREWSLAELADAHAVIARPANSARHCYRAESGLRYRLLGNHHGVDLVTSAQFTCATAKTTI